MDKENGRKKILKVASDLIYSMAGLMVMNGVIQLVLYPYLNGRMGQERFGTMLYLLSVVAVMATTFGTSANFSRMMAVSGRTHSNGEYNIFLWIISALCLPVTFVALIARGSFSLEIFIFTSLVMIASVYRYYADVQFRMTINFKGFFIYYALIAAGYVAGVLVYRFVDGAVPGWAVAILLGECFALIYVFFKGTILRKPFLERSKDAGTNIRSMITLSGSNFISATILNADRILLELFVDSVAVTTFYTASLIGKIVALLTTPLNGVIISYISRFNKEFTRRMFGMVALAAICVGVLGTFVCTGVSYIFVSIAYPDVFEAARPFFVLANAGQLFYFVSGSVMVVLLRFTGEKDQLYINTLYAILFAAVVIPSVILYGIRGVAVSLLLVNLGRMAIVISFGFIRLKKTGNN